MSQRTNLFSILSGLTLALVATGCGPSELLLEEGALSDEALAYDHEQAELAFPGETGIPRVGIFEFDEPVVLDYEWVQGEKIFEGDIILESTGKVALTSDELASREDALATTLVSKLWPGAKIPYDIDPALPSKGRVTDAIAHWQSKTRLRFVKRTTETDYVRFVRGTGCSSYVGRIGGAQKINLADNCSTGSTIHEIGHAAGLWHEQSRSDRGDHIAVRWANIQTGKESNFKTLSQLGVRGMDVGAYDIGSIMHYGPYSFSSNGKPTLVRRDGTVFTANRNGLSTRDLKGIEQLYTCKDTPYLDICDNAFRNSIAWLNARGMAVPCGNGLYCPNRATTRGEMAAFLTRVLNLPAGPDAFSDDEGHPYEAEINALAASKITRGCGTGKFCPEAKLNRAQMATFLTRAFNLPSGPDAFDDDAGNPHESAINALAASGVTKGCGTRRYCPAQSITRGQLSAMLHRALIR